MTTIDFEEPRELAERTTDGFVELRERQVDELNRDIGHQALELGSAFGYLAGRRQRRDVFGRMADGAREWSQPHYRSAPLLGARHAFSTGHVPHQRWSEEVPMFPRNTAPNGRHEQFAGTTLGTLGT
jgi:hypothetical protein